MSDTVKRNYFNNIIGDLEINNEYSIYGRDEDLICEKINDWLKQMPRW